MTARLRSIAGLLASQVNWVYAATAGAGGCSILSFLPMVTEGVRLLSALGALASVVLSFVLAYRKRKEKQKQ